MKRILAALALAMFVGGSVIGCEASAKVGDNDAGYSTRDHDTTVKKTTTIQPDGDRVTRTEVRHD
jgi:hypothetical protein